MAGKIAALALVGTLLAPSGLWAQSQNGQATARTGSTDEAQVFFSTLRTIRDYHIDQANDSILWEKAIAGLLQELDDPYATVFTPSEVEAFREETTGDYAGIGVQISGLDNSITVTIVFKGTPAEDVGLLVGDRIVTVNGVSTEGWTTGDAADQIRGPEGSTVDIEIARDGADRPVPYTIRRDNVHVSSVRSAMIGGDVGYIVVDRIARGSAREVDAAIRELDGAHGIVLDLRRNPGGYLDESLILADLFVPEGQTIAGTRNRAVREVGESEERYTAQITPRIPDTPITILVDRYTASAAEIISGALQDHDRAVILGERTFGKGVVQTVLPLPAGRQIRLTTGSWFTPLGRSLHRARTRGGELLPENTDSLPTYVTDGGREILGGGGIFPDLAIADDTLTLAERELFNVAGREGVPVVLRLAERALDLAKTSLDSGEAPEVTAAESARFVEELVAEGLPREAIDAPGVQDYLSWRLKMAAAERADRLDLSLETRMERDPVLTEAVKMLREAQSQADLFAAVEMAAQQDRADGFDRTARRR